MGLLDVHGGAGLCLLICMEEEKLGWVVMGQVGQSVSVMTKVGGTSCREGMGGGFGSELVEVDVVRQW